MKKTSFLFIFLAAILCVVSCGVRMYKNPELLKQTAVTFPKEYETIITPLDSQLVPIRKGIFFLKNEIAVMKDNLWDGGSNQRIMRIDDNIDSTRKEISALSAIRKDILNTIYAIHPGYREPEIVPYQGEEIKYKKFTTPIILITLQDQRAFEDMKANGEKLSKNIVYKPLIRNAMIQFEALPDSLKPKIQPIGSPGPVRRLGPYTPPKPR
jgi:hypothetical protein